MKELTVKPTPVREESVRFSSRPVRISPVQFRDVSTQVIETDLQEPTNNSGGTAEIPSFTEVLGHYQTTATIHGVSQTTGPHPYPYRSLVWFLVILASSGGLIVTLCLELYSLAQHPIKTTIRADLEERLHFPAVTVCNLNQYHRDRVSKDNMMVVFNIFNDGMIINFSEENWTFTIPNNVNISDISGQELLNISRYAAPTLDELIPVCFWRSRKYDCRELFSPVYTSLGTCYTLNNNRSALRMVSRTGPTEGLRLWLDIKSDKSYFSAASQAGIKVIVHEPEEIPFPEQGWFVRPGVAASIALSRHERTCLPRPYKAFEDQYCEDTLSNSFKNPLKRFSKYSTAACLEECRVNRLVQKCGCRLINDAGNDTICSVKDYVNCYSRAASTMDLVDVENCGCPSECKSVTYIPVFSYANFSPKFKEIFGGSQDYIGKSNIDLRIFFKTLIVKDVHQVPEKSLSSILASLGGHMGLFLGASILSATELGEVLLLVFLRCLRARRGARDHEHGRRSNQQHDPNAVTVT